MKPLNKYRKFISSFLIILLIILNYSCSRNNNEQVEVNSKSSQIKNKQITLTQFSGKDLFTGLIFCDGKVADIFEFTSEQKRVRNGLSSKTLKGLNKMQGEIIQILHTKDSNYFKNFKKEILSEDHIRIQSILKQSFEDFRKIVLNLYAIDITLNTSVEDVIEKFNLNSSLAKEVKNSDGSININKLKQFDSVYNNNSNIPLINNKQADKTCVVVEVVAVAVVVWVWLWIWIAERNYYYNMNKLGYDNHSDFVLNKLVNDIVVYSSSN